jgi:UDPglucose 6-dehydrogenase
MKIGVIGLGVIGSACKYGFEKLGHQVSFHDIAFETTINDVLDSEIIYVCVPTPQMGGGSCDTSIVEKVVEDLNENKFTGIIAIKSTVKPTTTEMLIKKYWELNICFVPEFLRERCAITDFTENHDLLAVGTHEQYIYDKVVECHGKYPKTTQWLSPTEAELLKYYSNVFNAVRIIFANEMYEICKAVKADYTKIKDTFIKRGTTTDMYLDVNENFRGYAGVCLPKDVSALASFVRELDLNLDLFETIDYENKKFKATVFDGMREK